MTRERKLLLILEITAIVATALSFSETLTFLIWPNLNSSGSWIWVAFSLDLIGIVFITLFFTVKKAVWLIAGVPLVLLFCDGSHVFQNCLMASDYLVNPRNFPVNYLFLFILAVSIYAIVVLCIFRSKKEA
jgi:hypothetical protein